MVPLWKSASFHSMIPLERLCKACGKTKKLIEFHKDRHHPYGVRTQCKECVKSIQSGKAVLTAKSEYDKQRYAQIHEHRLNQCKVYQQQKRKVVLDHYGHRCACCGEKRFEFLAVDHINGGGGKHRKQIHRSIESWLIKNNFPDGFRLLCHNCNMSLGRYGYCPHQTETTDCPRKPEC
jgi:hypothetical protein